MLIALSNKKKLHHANLASCQCALLELQNDHYCLPRMEVCIVAFPKLRLLMNRALHILLCLLTFLKISGMCGVCESECCSKASAEQRNCCFWNGCGIDCPPLPSNEIPCDSPCCGTPDSVAFIALSGVDDLSPCCLSCACVYDASFLMAHLPPALPSTTPSRGINTHLFVCVFLC